MSHYKYVVVGAGLAGLVVAERIADVLGDEVLLIEKHSYIGGTCHDSYNDYGLLVGDFGPHTFHTNDEEVFNYVLQFTKWHKYTHRAMSYVDGKFVDFPITIHTLNQVFKTHLTEKDDIKSFVEKHNEEITNKFYFNFTAKQWECKREELDQDVLKRVSFRPNFDNRYFTDKYQGNPKGGYSKMFAKMVENKNIKILLNTDYKDVIDDITYDTLIYTGPVDYFFDYSLGKLIYRSVKFVFETYKTKSFRPVASTRYPNNYRYTRITEFKKMTGQKSPYTTILKEYPCFEGDPYYPYPTMACKKLGEEYAKLAQKQKNVYFVGRLGEYLYLDMDDVIRHSLDLFAKIAKKEAK
jgi:UDP-galactopyranose mutase